VIRLANVGDIDRVVTMMADAFSESPFAGFCEFSPEMVRAQFLHHLSSESSLCLVNDSGSANGLFVVTVADHASAPLRMCLEVVKWIDPAHRNGKAWLQMLRWAERWAREQKCTIASLSGLDCPGYEPVETHYVKVL
jgi:hypothetical protein